MPPSFVDTHIHLEEVPDWPAAVDEAVQAGVTGLIAMGTDLSTSRGAIAMAEQHPAVWAAVGHHPMNQAPPDLPALRELTRHPRVVAIGEVGLDHSTDEHVGPHEAQEAWFRTLIALALDTRMPVCVHIRDSAAGSSTSAFASPSRARSPAARKSRCARWRGWCRPTACCWRPTRPGARRAAGPDPCARPG